MTIFCLPRLLPRHHKNHEAHTGTSVNNESGAASEWILSLEAHTVAALSIYLPGGGDSSQLQITKSSAGRIIIPIVIAVQATAVDRSWQQYLITFSAWLELNPKSSFDGFHNNPSVAIGNHVEYLLDIC